MTPSEWLTLEDPSLLFGWLTDCPPPGQSANPIVLGHCPIKVSERKRRLFAVSCCRLVWHLLEHANSRAAVEIAERYADGEATLHELRIAERNATLVAGVSGPVAASWMPAWAADDIGSLDQVLSDRMHPDSLTSRMADLLRDIIGDPFDQIKLPITWQPADRRLYAGGWKDVCPWLTPQVLSLAQAAYDDNGPKQCCKCHEGKVLRIEPVKADSGAIMDFIDHLEKCPTCAGSGQLDDGSLDSLTLAALADALLEAGCTHESLLTHLRSSASHVRGCFALDLLLGKG